MRSLIEIIFVVMIVVGFSMIVRDIINAKTAPIRLQRLHGKNRAGIRS